jgi:hypothetical protein
MNKIKNVSNKKGPYVYENWKAAIADKPSIETVEYQLFTDSNVGGDILTHFGPYKILYNAVSVLDSQLPIPAFTLRLDDHLEDDDQCPEIPEKTDVKLYHGGYIADEVTALVSLSLGIRLKAGGITRHFDINGDPKGYPTCSEIHENPFLPKTVRHKQILPQLLSGHPITVTRELYRFPNLSLDGAGALIRTARLYQDAVWIAESEPELSWIMLVSAVENAAESWSKSNATPVERLKTSKPDLVKLLNDAGDEELVLKVAEEIVDCLGATKKFVDFILEFMPEPPKKRPSINAQHSWYRTDMEKSMRIIYGHRSKALHGGIKFPLPMCNPPVPDGNGFSEKPFGLATEALGAVWIAKDTPMLLHTFEYIVRNALLKWWESMLPKTN